MTIFPAVAAAQPNMAAAARAFASAQEQMLAEDWSAAARSYELANRIAPTPEALVGATDARLRMGDEVRAATMALSLRRLYPENDAATALSTRILDEYASKFAHVQASCQPLKCTLQIDGRALGLEALATHEFFLRPGAHTIIAFAGERGSKPETVTAAEQSDLVLKFDTTKPAPVPTPAPPRSAMKPPAAAGAGPPPSDELDDGGASPALAITGIALTAVLGGVTIWSGIDTLTARDAYVAAPTRQAFDDGTGRELRTNVLVVSTGVVGAATLVTALLFTDWGGDNVTDERSAAAGQPIVWCHPNGAGIGWRGSF